jgi:hypothetical protein
MALNERKDKTGKIKEVPLELNNNQTNALNECRKLSAGDADIEDLRDATLCRFLRHNDWKAAPSITQMKEYLRWRKDTNVDTILENAAFPSRDIIRTIVPYAYHCFDKDGRPIYIEKTGQIAAAALADPSICNPDHFLHSHIYGVELMQRRMYEMSLQKGERVNGITTILDLAGLGFHHRQCVYVLKQALNFDKKYYPEYLGKLYVINAPWVTPYIFQAVQMFLDEATKERIHMVPGYPAEFLLQHIDAESLPAEYGGKCTGKNCQHGGLGADCALVPSCVDTLDSSKLKPVLSPSSAASAAAAGLEEQLVSYEFETVVSSSSGGNDETFTWYFEEKTNLDLDFSVLLLPVNGVKETDENKKVYIQKTERVRQSKGSFKAPYPNAKLLFRWDNNFSWMAKKNIRYMVSCINDDSHNMDAILSSSSAKPSEEAKE